MKNQEWTYVDKLDYGLGEWTSEPDKIQWTDEATSLPCLIVRGPVGALCGYVGVPESHPFFKADYENVDVNVHGGLTYADLCQPDGKICHVVEPGDDDNVWWLGFDCSHYPDFVPASMYRGPGDVYRNVAYVKRQVTELARQLRECA